MFGNFGWSELLLVLAIALLIFGAERLPKIGKSLGSSIHEFKNAVNPKEEKPVNSTPLLEAKTVPAQQRSRKSRGTTRKKKTPARKK